MYSDRFMKDYIRNTKLHESQRLSYNEREKFWIKYWKDYNENV